MTVVLLIAGLALILAGANYLTEGAADLAKRLRVSDFIVGLTVVAFGTSAPELIVSLVSALGGKGDMAVGNVVGSNLFNILVILGITAIITPLRFTRNNLKKDVLFGILSAIVLFIVASDTLLDGASANIIGRNEGLLMLCFFTIFLLYTIYSTQEGPKQIKREEKPAKTKYKLWLSLVMVVGGLAALVYGGDLFVDNATVIARNLGVSESVIAVTLLAGGTSLPELSASIASALKKKPEMALGNVIGSNIFNVFLILGVSATVSPLNIQGIIPQDMIALIVASILLFVTAYTFKKGRIDRAEGIVFVLLYVGYIFWMLNR